MAKVRPSLESKTSRAKLAPKKAPYLISLQPRLSLGYYRSPKGQGTWHASLNPSKGKGGWKRITLGYADDLLDADGEGVLNYTQAQAQAKARNWAQAIDEGTPLEAVTGRDRSAPYTVGDAWEDYIQHAKSRGVKGVKIMTQTWEAHIRPTFGATVVKVLTRKMIDEWKHKLAETPRRSTGKKREEVAHQEAAKTEDEKRARKDSANRILTNLKAALNHGLDMGHPGIPESAPWRLVAPFAKTTACRVRVLSVTEQRQLVAACSTAFEPLVRGALYTGARYGELIKVRVSATMMTFPTRSDPPSPAIYDEPNFVNSH